MNLTPEQIAVLQQLGILPATPAPAVPVTVLPPDPTIARAAVPPSQALRQPAQTGKINTETPEAYAARVANRGMVYYSDSDGKVWEQAPGKNGARKQIKAFPAGLIMVGYDPKAEGSLSRGERRITVAYAELQVTLRDRVSFGVYRR